MSRLQYQTIHAGPLANCVQAATATLLDLPLEDVPNFAVHGHPDWFHAWWKWIEARGFQIWQYQKPAWTPKGMYLAVGPAGHPDGDHCVVMLAGELFHDPAGPMAVGLQSIDFILLLLPLDPAIRHISQS